MKAWRRSYTHRARATLASAVVLADIGAETVEGSALAPWVGTHFLLFEQSPNGVDTWTFQQETPISSDPQNFDMAGFAGVFVRATVTTGNLDPLTDWSNIVQVGA